MQTKIYSAKSGVKEGYRELDQLADQYRSKLRNLKFHQDYYQAMKSLPASSSMPNDFMSIIQSGSLGMGAAGLPGAAIGVGLGVLDQENRSAYNEIRQQMSANENSLRLAALQNDISNLDDSLREHRAIQERAGIHLGVLINEEIMAQAEADRIDFYLNRLRSQSDNFLTELDPPTLYENNLQEYNKRLSILTFFLVKSFEYKWKTKVTENELALSLNLISPEDFDHFASNLDWHESKLMEKRGRPGINDSDISNSSYNKYYVIYEFSDQFNSKLFESFKKTGLIDFKVNFDTESAENSDLAFPSSHESAEIITADIWYSGNSCRMSEEPLIAESSEVEDFFSGYRNNY